LESADVGAVVDLVRGQPVTPAVTGQKEKTHAAEHAFDNAVARWAERRIERVLSHLREARHVVHTAASDHTKGSLSHVDCPLACSVFSDQSSPGGWDGSSALSSASSRSARLAARRLRHSSARKMEMSCSVASSRSSLTST